MFSHGINGDNKIWSGNQLLPGLVNDPNQQVGASGRPLPC